MGDTTENILISQNTLPSDKGINDMILTIRGVQVLLDSDVARLYGYEVKRINEVAARNRNRFPEHFRFRLNQDEAEQILRSQFATSRLEQDMRSQFATASKRNNRYLPYAYTEQGIGMLSGFMFLALHLKILETNALAYSKLKTVRTSVFVFNQ